MGTTAEAGITNPTEDQMAELKESSFVLDTGIDHTLMELRHLYFEEKISTSEHFYGEKGFITR